MIPKKSLAFTLLEITIVLSIVAIFFAISIPTFSQILHIVQLNKEAHAISSWIRFAQEQASTKKTTYNVKFFSKSFFYDKARYSVEYYDYFKGKFVEIKSVELPNRFDFKEDVTITFSSSSFPVPGGSGTIVLKDFSGREKRIIVSSVGRVRIE